MLSSRQMLAALATGLLLFVCLGLPSTASAHERRKIAAEKAEVVVGWLNEPAYLDQPNAVSFTVTNPADQQPIEGLEKTVKVEVIKGAATRQYDLAARFGQKGAYVANLIPTAAGDYTFRFTGEINGTKIDEKFESGPGRFNPIISLNTVQFPTAQPAIGELQSQVAAANAAADSARTIGFIGLAVGLLGLIAAGAALFMFMRRPSAGGHTAANPGD